MKIRQEKALFIPIVITLETEKEAEAFIHLIEPVTNNPGKALEKTSEEMRDYISNAFSNDRLIY